MTFLAKRLRAGGGSIDPFRSNVTTLLNFNGTNGASNNTVTDLSANNYSILKYGSPAIGFFSPNAAVGSMFCRSDVATSYYISSAPALSYTGNFTWEAWVYISGGGISSEIVSKHTSGLTGWYSLYVNSSNQAYFQVWDAANISNTVTSTVTMTVGTWNHICGGRNGSTIFVGCNGTYTSAALTVTPRSTDGAVYFGTNAGGSANKFNGFISTIHSTNTALYTGNYTVPSPNLSPTAGVTQFLCKFNTAAIFDTTNKVYYDATASATLNTTEKKYGTAGLSLAATNYIRARYLSSFTGFNIGTADFTIEGYFKFITVSGLQTLIDFRPGVNGLFPMLYLNSGPLTYYVNSANVITGSTLTAGVWYHIALCRVSGVTRLFVAGTQVGSSWTDTTNYGAVTNGYPIIGANMSLTNAGNCYSDDIRVTVGVGRYISNFTPPPFQLPY